MYKYKICGHFAATLVAFIFIGCTTIPEKSIESPIVENDVADRQDVSFDEITNIIWELSEIRISYGKMELDRAAMAANGIGDVFIFQFTEEGINGKAAPNRYFSTYELRNGHDFLLRPIVSTFMAANINIGGLIETEYYRYLQRANHWEIVKGGLELLSTGQNDEEVTLRFLRQGAN